ncbi:MAG: surface-adhesin E family protein [Ramlibacter sp.]
MKRKIGATVLLVLVSASAGAEWVLVDENDERRAYVDFGSIRKEGDLRRVWGVQDLKNQGPRGEMSELALSEWDCKEGRRRQVSSMLFAKGMTTGKLVGTGNAEPGGWESAGPHTFNDSLQKAVCAR